MVIIASAMITVTTHERPDRWPRAGLSCEPRTVWMLTGIPPSGRPRQPPLSALSLMPRNIFWLITKLTVAMGSTINGAQRLL